jgi:PIN domain nuclease of toxin-antitoxin system
MIAAVVDTHALLWYLYADARLSARARMTIDNALQQRQRIVVATITLVEMVYLIERARIPDESLARLLAVLEDASMTIEAHPLDLSVAQALGRIDRTQIPDMPDRIIA